MMGSPLSSTSITKASRSIRLRKFTRRTCCLPEAMRSAVVWADDRAAGGDVAALTAALCDGALHGARGNSGVILSQILRGLAEVSAGRSLTEIDGPVLAEAGGYPL